LRRYAEYSFSVNRQLLLRGLTVNPRMPERTDNRSDRLQAPRDSAYGPDIARWSGRTRGRKGTESAPIPHHSHGRAWHTSGGDRVVRDGPVASAQRPVGRRTRLHSHFSIGHLASRIRIQLLRLALEDWLYDPVRHDRYLVR